MTIDDLNDIDVLVIGAGNAAANAALAAREGGAKRIALLESAPEEARGGNSAFTGGAFRFVYESVDDLLKLAPDIAELDLPNIDFGTYTREQYFDDIGRLTEFRADPDLTDVLIGNSYDAALWLKRHGVRFQPALGRQAFRVEGKFRFWGGLACHILGGGTHLVETLHHALKDAGIGVLYRTQAMGLLHGDGRIEGVRAMHEGRQVDIRAKAVVLACGGFESSAEMRARYLGPNWDLAKVRGTRYNTGWGHKMAMEIGAAVTGHWSGAHAVQWDMNAPEYGDLTIGDRFQKHNYPFGILVNAKGERFLDEGLDFHSFTYANIGMKSCASQVFSRGRSSIRKSSSCCATSTGLRALPKRRRTRSKNWRRNLPASIRKVSLRTARAYNEAPRPDVSFNPNIHDGLRTRGLAIDKHQLGQSARHAAL